MIDITLDRIRVLEKTYKLKSFTFISEFLSSICSKNNQKVEKSNEEKVIYLITGGIAAGKSTLSYNLIKTFHLENYPFVGTDIFYNLYFSNLQDFDIGYEKARNYTDEILNDYANNGISFIWETVISKQKKIDFLKRCFDLGYKIICFFIGTDNYEITINRTRIRHNEGDHFVPEQFVADRYKKTIDSLWEIKPLAFKFAVFDNTDKFNLLYYADKTVIFENRKLPLWYKR